MLLLQKHSLAKNFLGGSPSIYRYIYIYTCAAVHLRKPCTGCDHRISDLFLDPCHMGSHTPSSEELSPFLEAGCCYGYFINAI